MKLKNQKSKTIFLFVIGLFLLVSPAYSAIYHIDPEAKTIGDGSFARPFNSWWNLPMKTMKTSDQVYFKCNTTYSPSSPLFITWEGTTSNPAVIGSYYIENSNVIYGIKGNRPIISGSNYTVPSNSYYGSSDSWRGLIQVNSKEHVHIKDLHILKSGFQGIRIAGDVDSETNSSNFLIKNVKVDGSWNAGIQINGNPNNYGFVEDCEVTGASYAFWVTNGRPWGSALNITNSPYSYTTIRRNYVHSNWGEGINSTRPLSSTIYNHSGYVTVEDNIVWNNRRVDIYLGRTEGNIVRRNILLGAAPPVVNNYSTATLDGRGWNQYGVWINAEDIRGGEAVISTSNNSVYNNLIAGHVSGMGISSEFTEGVLENIFFYNNTLIGNRTNISIGSKLSGYTMKNVEFKNNISYCPSDTVCKDINSDRVWHKEKMTFDYNTWSIKPKYAGGPNDQKVNSNWIKTQGWQQLTSVPNIQNFAMMLGNPAINSGASLGDLYKKAIDTARTSFLPPQILVNTIDQSGSRWDMGAALYQNDYTASPVQAPSIMSIEPIN